jgi:hypothetical protein
MGKGHLLIRCAVTIIAEFGRGTRPRIMKPCRECRREISEQATFCPQCGAPHPARDKWDGWGFEYKSNASILGLPLLHISFKYRPNRVPVVARGVISIGQFGCGIINISQFGIGIISISQFTVALYALAQFAFAYSLIAQIGICLHEGHGQVVINLVELLRRLGG